MFRRFFLAYLVLLVLALAVHGGLAFRSMRGRMLDETALRLRAETEMLEALARSRADPRSLQEALRRLGGSAFDARLTVIAADGSVLADSLADPFSMDNHGSRPEVQAARASGNGTNVRYSDTVHYEMMYHARLLDPGRPDGLIVRAALPLTRVKKEVEDLFRSMAVTFIVVALAGAAVTWGVVRWMTRPLREIREFAHAIAAGDFGSKTLARAPADIAQVAAAMNRMSEELSARLASLRAESIKLQAVFSSMEEGVLAIDASGRILHFNRSAQSLFDLTMDPQGLRVWEVIRQPGLQEEVQKVLERDIGSRTHFEFGRRAIALSISPFGERQGAVLLARDATEERRYDALRKEFVANVSHELRTPLSLIRGYVETLREGALKDEVRAAEFLEIIEKNAARLAAIVEDLLQLSRMESAGQIVNPREVPVDALLRKVGEHFAPLLEKERHVLSIDVASGAESAYVDPDLLERALGNLVDNAIKYTPVGGRIELRGERKGSELLLSVRDNGVGIPEADQPRVFERFYRVDKSRSRELGGTGLGLAIVKHVAQIHGGRVTVRSKPGEGSLFTLHLPRKS